MITIRLVGGLGNQMFQYAAGYALAQRVGTSVAIDATALELDRLRNYQLGAFCIEATPASVHLPAGRIARVLRRLRGPRREYRNFDSIFDPTFFSLSDGVALNGLFQSWRYLIAAETEIRALFALRSPLSPRAVELATAIASEPSAVSLHVRRGDYLSPETAPIHGAMTLAFYERAIAVLRGLLSNEPHFFLFSDDPEWVRENLGGLGAHTVVEGQDAAPWEDLALMSQCRHHIIANSSFSWWGAWLNPRQDKWVIAPRQWFTAETLREKNVCDLLPPEWIAV
jgi:hypothetical protein